MKQFGAAQNPLRVLSKILAAMHDDNGRVTIPGFYDGVPELPSDVKADLKGLDLTPEKFLGQVGLKVPAGEKDRMLIEQMPLIVREAAAAAYFLPQDGDPAQTKMVLFADHREYEQLKPSNPLGTTVYQKGVPVIVTAADELPEDVLQIELARRYVKERLAESTRWLAIHGCGYSSARTGSRPYRPNSPGGG